MSVIIVVFDTCVLFDDWFLKSSSLNAIKQHAKVIMPAVVIDELKNKYEEKLYKVYSDFCKSFNDIIKLQTKNISSFIPANEDSFYGTICDDNSFLSCIKSQDTFIKEYSHFINQQASNGEFAIADYPTMTHQEIVSRALLGKKPFSNDGKKGYRDYLIWLTVLEIAKENPKEEIHFISSNVADFAKGKQDNDKPMLHADFSGDIENMNIHYWNSLNNFLDSKIKPILEADDSFAKSGEKEQLIASINNNEKFMDEIKDLVKQKAIGLSYYSDEIEEILDFKELDDEYDIDLSLISYDECLLKISFATICSVNMVVSKSEFINMSKKELRGYSITESDNNHSILLNSMQEIDFITQMIFEKSAFTVKGFEVIGIEDGSCPYCPDFDEDEEDDEEDNAQ